MAQVEEHLHKKHLVGSNHPRHSGFMTGFYAFPVGTLPTQQPASDPDNDGDNDSDQTAAQEIAEDNSGS